MSRPEDNQASRPTHSQLPKSTAIHTSSPTDRKSNLGRGIKTPKRAAAEAALAGRYGVDDLVRGQADAGHLAKRLKTSPKRAALSISGCQASCTSER
jgi:hypothetical protein